MEIPGSCSATVTTVPGIQLIGSPVYAANMSPRFSVLSPAQFPLPAVVLQQNVGSIKLPPPRHISADGTHLSANTRLLLTAAVQQPLVLSGNQSVSSQPPNVINQSHSTFVTQVVAKQLPVSLSNTTFGLKAENALAEVRLRAPVTRLVGNYSPAARSTVIQQHSIAAVNNVQSSLRPLSVNQTRAIVSSSAVAATSAPRLNVPPYTQMSPGIVTFGASSVRQPVPTSQPSALATLSVGSQRYIIGSPSQPLQVRTVPHVLARVPSGASIVVPQLSTHVSAAPPISVPQVSAHAGLITAMTIPQASACATSVTVQQLFSRTPLMKSTPFSQISAGASLGLPVSIRATLSTPGSEMSARAALLSPSPARAHVLSSPVCSKTDVVTVFDAYPRSNQMINPMVSRPGFNRLSTPNSQPYISTPAQPSMFVGRPVGFLSSGLPQSSNRLLNTSLSYSSPVSSLAAASVIGSSPSVPSVMGNTSRTSVDSVATTVASLNSMSASISNANFVPVSSSVAEQNQQNFGFTAVVPSSMIENFLQNLCSSATATPSGMNVSIRSINQSGCVSVSQATFTTQSLTPNIVSAAGAVYQIGTQPLTLLNTNMAVNHATLLNSSSNRIYRAGVMPVNCPPPRTVLESRGICQRPIRPIRGASRPAIKRCCTPGTITGKQQLKHLTMQSDLVMLDASSPRFGGAVTMVRPGVINRTSTSAAQNAVTLRHTLLYQPTVITASNSSSASCYTTQMQTSAQIFAVGNQPLVAGLKRKFIFGKRYNFNLNCGSLTAYFNGANFQIKKPATNGTFANLSRVVTSQTHIDAIKRTKVGIDVWQPPSAPETMASDSQPTRYYCGNCCLVNAINQCLKCGQLMTSLCEMKTASDEDTEKSSVVIINTSTPRLGMLPKPVVRTYLTKKALKSRANQSKKVEPEVVQILSSDDEEDENATKPVSAPDSDVVVSSPSRSETVLNMSVLEPTQAQALVVASKTANVVTTLTLPISMKVRFVRIGTMPLSHVVECLFFLKVLRISFIPEGSSGVTHLALLCSDIKLFKIHYGPSGPVVFLVMSAEFGRRVRSLLRMASQNFVYDPESNEDCLKYVLIVPQQSHVSESEMEAVVRQMQSQPTVEFDYECLPPNAASSLLINILKSSLCSTPMAAAASINVPSSQVAQPILMASANQIRLVVPSGFTRLATSAATNNGDEDEEMADRSRSPSPPHPIFSGPVVKLFIYPPAPATGGITVTNEDLYCLNDGEFLNDVIIDFYLKYIQIELLSAETRAKTHVFSSFFYRRLTQKQPRGSLTEDTASMTLPQRRHLRVKTWTRNVDLFSKDFIIVPINESAHWYLAIICFPGIVQPTFMDLPEASECANDTGSAVEQQSTKEPIRKLLPSIKQPCILVFDSLMGIPQHTGVIRTLREYMQQEWNVRKSTVSGPRVFSKETFKGTSVRCPQQTNFSDCGIYVLQYVESFFTQPIRNYAFPLLSLLNWFTEELILTRRESLRQLVLNLQRRLNSELQYDPQQDGMQISLLSSRAAEYSDNTPSSVPLIALESQSACPMVVDTEVSNARGEEVTTLNTNLVHDESESSIIIAPGVSVTVTTSDEPLPLMVADPIPSDTVAASDEPMPLMVVDPIPSDTVTAYDEPMHLMVVDPILSDTVAASDEPMHLMVVDPVPCDSASTCNDSTYKMVAEPASSNSVSVCVESMSVIGAEPVSSDTDSACEDLTSVMVIEQVASASASVCDEWTPSSVAEEQVTANCSRSSAVAYNPSVMMSSLLSCSSATLCYDVPNDAKLTISSENNSFESNSLFCSMQSTEVSNMEAEETANISCDIEPVTRISSVVQGTQDSSSMIGGNEVGSQGVLLVPANQVDNGFVQPATVTVSVTDNIEMTGVFDTSSHVVDVDSVAPTHVSDLPRLPLNSASNSIRFVNDAGHTTTCVVATSTVLPRDFELNVNCVDPVSYTLEDPASRVLSETKFVISDAVNVNCVTSDSMLDSRSSEVHNEQHANADDMSCR